MLEGVTVSGARSFPKVELHCHIEGTVRPALARRLAARHGLDLSGVIDAQDRYLFSTFAEFLKAYDAMSEAVRTPEDYHDVLYDYYRAAAGEGLIYGEMFISASHPARFGLGYRAFVDGLARAIEDVARDFNVHVRLILTAVRHEGVAAAEATARLAQAHPHPYVVGFGLAGDENHEAPAAFAKAFEIAAGAGLRLTAHAGELAGPESVRGALRDLRVERIGHGVRAIEAPELVAEIAARGVALEVCPGSNVVLDLFPSYAAHPVAALARAGVRVTLGSDDPPFVSTTIGAEYERVERAHELSPEEMLGFTRAGIEAAFCEADLKRALRARLGEAEGEGQV